jgi:energy-coupling factor transporter ATP-binding protein EcfA2
MIEVNHLKVRYETEAALADVTFQVRQGECLLVTGPSGCGKSTLARVLTGLIPHAIEARMEGQVCVDGLDIRQHSIPKLTEHVGTVFQNPASQLFHLCVEDEVAFGPRNLGLDDQVVGERVDWALEALGLSDLRNRRPVELSGGQKQRVAIAAALAMQPKVLVLDEPTASLDIEGTRLVIASLKRLQQRLGMTIVLIEHRLAEVAQLAERILILEDGRILAHGGLEEVLSDRKLLYRLGLRRLKLSQAGKSELADWKDLLAPNGHAPPNQAPLIELQGITAGYNGKPAIKEVDFGLYAGDFAALVGENGAGKSTLGLVIAGLLKPTCGKLLYQRRARSRPGLDISLLFQNPADQLFTESVDEELAFGPMNYRCFNPKEHERTLAEADLTALRSRRPVALSVGQQQRTALAACLALRPALVILDEPTLGQDWGHLQRLMDFLVELNRQGTAILLITHDYKLVYRYAERIFLMQAGRIVLTGNLRQKKTVTSPIELESL